MTERRGDIVVRMKERGGLLFFGETNILAGNAEEGEERWLDIISMDGTGTKKVGMSSPME
jgi:hypothetical protein